MATATVDTTERVRVVFGRHERHDDATWRVVYLAGGAGLVLYGLIYLTGVTLSRFMGGVAPADSAAYLQSLADHTALARVLYGLFALSDFLLLPAICALFFALRPVARGTTLLAAALLGVFAVLDVALTESGALTLVTLARHAAVAASEAQRAAYAAAADYALATVPLATFYSWALSSLGVLIVGLVMLRGGFGKVPAYLGIVAGVAGLGASLYVALPALAVLLTPTLIVYGLWAVLAGIRLYRRGQHAAR